jgi:hypothetical protein
LRVLRDGDRLWRQAAIFAAKVQKGHPVPLEGSHCLVLGVLAIGGFFGLNWIYQVIRKPGELFAPISAYLICLRRFIVRRSKGSFKNGILEVRLLTTEEAKAKVKID